MIFQDSVKVLSRAQRASERSERRERSDFDVLRLPEQPYGIQSMTQAYARHEIRMVCTRFKT